MFTEWIERRRRESRWLRPLLPVRSLCGSTVPLRVHLSLRRNADFLQKTTMTKKKKKNSGENWHKRCIYLLQKMSKFWHDEIHFHSMSGPIPDKSEVHPRGRKLQWRSEHLLKWCVTRFAHTCDKAIFVGSWESAPRSLTNQWAGGGVTRKLIKR